ncbi:archease [Limnoglobus roseus]|nr:archease [Limnoglobus roseus]
MHELFDHTADLGLRITAPDLNALFAEAGECLFSAVVEDVASIRPTTAATIGLTGDDREFLLFDWLRELLMQFEMEHMLYGRFDVQVRPDGLTATAWGEPLDRGRHHLSHEVKAITYHELKVVETDGGWLAEVIVDI